MRLDTALDPGSAKGGPKVVPRRLPRAVAEVRNRWGGVRIHADDRTDAIALRDGGQANRGLSLEAADLEDRALRGRACRDEREKARFALRQESRSSPDSCPGLVNGLGQIRRLTADG